jgi:hypothetical protein
MSNKLDPDQRTIYQIRIRGHLGQQWTDWFEGLTIMLEENGDTLLTGPVVDQPALHGLLKKVCGLGMPLLSVNRVGVDVERSGTSRRSKETEGGDTV